MNMIDTSVSRDLKGAAINGGSVILGQSSTSFFLRSNFAKNNFSSFSIKLIDGNSNLKVNGGARFIDYILE